MRDVRLATVGLMLVPRDLGGSLAAGGELAMDAGLGLFCYECGLTSNHVLDQELELVAARSHLAPPWAVFLDPGIETRVRVSAVSVG